MDDDDKEETRRFLGGIGCARGRATRWAGSISPLRRASFRKSRRNLSPHALQSVRAPSAPRRQLGVSVVPHSLHMRANVDRLFARDARGGSVHGTRGADAEATTVVVLARRRTALLRASIASLASTASPAFAIAIRPAAACAADGKSLICEIEQILC